MDQKTIVAYATRTRGYIFTKAAEKIDLWKVDSANGVEMTGSDATSDSTKMVDALIKGMELGAAYMGARSGMPPVAVEMATASYAPAVSATSAKVTGQSLISGEEGLRLSL